MCSFQDPFDMYLKRIEIEHIPLGFGKCRNRKLERSQILPDVIESAGTDRSADDFQDWHPAMPRQDIDSDICKLIQRLRPFRPINEFRCPDRSHRVPLDLNDLRTAYRAAAALSRNQRMSMLSPKE